MIFKIVSLFLVGMGVLAMFGKLTVPGAKRFADAKCRSCGKFTFGKPCTCKERN
ncbi:hypothetical protein OCA8868_02811 [Octadecabacter ascidiaceicola]|uniref:Uncharacterized protein n=1 Tax=Octadecabacter ascidiaceicola TaxID=1655543 RepID=A0A238KIF3_9RHOB|nr:hypothetical protein OCA8868_02811 [Octadecabacter ascidiaceicola]